MIEPVNVDSATSRIKTQLAGVTKQAHETESSLKGLKEAFVGVAEVLAFREIVKASDTFVEIRNQLRSIVNDTKDLEPLQDAIFKIAQETRTEYQLQGELVTKIGRANASIGASTKDILTVSKAVSESFKISGTSAAETETATKQLGLSLAQGHVEGRQLRTVLENNFTLAETIAKGFGVSVTQLKKMGEEGKLLSKDVFAAILKDSENLNARFEGLTPTIEQAGKALENSFVQTVGKLDEALGTSDAFAEAILEAAHFVDNDLTPALVDGAHEFQAFVSITIGQIDLLLSRISVTFNEIKVKIAEARDESSTFDTIVKGLGKTGKDVQKTFAELPDGLRQIAQGSMFGILAGEAANFAGATDDVSAAQQDLAAASRDYNEVAKIQDDLQKRLIANALQREKDAAKVTKPGKVGGAFREDPPVLDQKTKDAIKSADQLTKSLSEQAVQLSLTNAFQLQAAAAIEATGARGGEAADILTAFGIKASKAMRDYQIATLEAAGATKTQVEQLHAISDALQEIDTLTAKADADKRDKAVIDNLKEELRLLKLTKNERDADVVLSQLSAENRVKEKDNVTALIAETNKLKAQQKFFEDFNRTLAEGFAEGIRGVISSAFDGEFKSIQDSFSNLLVKLGEQLLTSVLLNQLSKVFEGLAAGSGGGGIWGALAGALSSGRASGGSVEGGKLRLVGERGPELFVPPAGGGTILPDLSAAGGGKSKPTTIINSVDPMNAINAMETARGREVIKNAIRQEPSFYRSILGN